MVRNSEYGLEEQVCIAKLECLCVQELPFVY